MYNFATTKYWNLDECLGSVKELPGDNSEWEPPESIPNSEVKTLSADDSVGSPHVKVGHCQALV